MALALKRTVAELKSQMSQTEYESWQAFYSVRPFGDEWDDYRFGYLAANIMSMLSTSDEGINIERCMPLIHGRDNTWRGRQKPEDIAAILRSETKAVEEFKCRGRSN